MMVSYTGSEVTLLEVDAIPRVHLEFTPADPM